MSVCPGRGLLLLWGEADGLCRSQPTELVGSSSDIPPCHADTRSQPIVAEIVFLAHNSVTCSILQK